ncbi:ABC transporter ATP-binding protein [Tessaracoccus antarcticus]|uniref:ABC transporter ATP-binding protein n=1 Tax=Tessaracoccus antarcticus TaxID=2479848 RepID=UPI001F28586F|nr:ATP-binding cassette domain-containing protein [Tessaracoccus antarcticus]
MTTQFWSETPSTWAIRTSGLSKRFGRTVAVAGLDLNVPIGGVHALLGPNGSGKTTTLRMLLGLVRADEGVMELCGVPVPERLDQVISYVGAIVESPKFAPSMTLRRNLEILAMSIGVNRRRVTEVLLEVGLGGRADTRFRQCSLGMKQRLAIAATLLKEPQVLIFDEPTNGLDPSGIQEIRTTIRDIANAGRTVLISSHLLGEVEQVADSVSIIGRGRTLMEGDLATLLSGDRSRVVVEVADHSLAHEALRQAGYAVVLSGGRLHVTGPGGGAIEAGAVARVLGGVDLWPQHLSVERSTLESVFLEVTATEHLTATQGLPRTEAS